MVSLPPAKQTNINDHEPNVLSAYNVVLDFEHNAKTDNDAMHARILGYLILHAPSIHARHEMVRVIHSCEQNPETLSELGQHFINFFIHPFKRYKGHTPAPSDHSSHSSFDKDKVDMLVDVREAPRNHQTTRAQALVRDDYKCVVMGAYDIQGRNIPCILKELRKGGGTSTQCAHIVPDSTYFNVSTPGDPSDKYAPSVLAVLKHFGYDVDNLNGEKVHSLYNVISLKLDVHKWFDGLLFWFEATEIKNCYRLEIANEYSDVLKFPEKITLMTTDPVNLPVPSPELLALHAACAKVANLSGAGTYIDKFDQEMEDLNVLAGDGRSADLLSHAIMRLMSVAHVGGLGV